MRKLYYLIVLIYVGSITADAQFKLLYQFNGTSGSTPEGYLTLIGNKLYGTTRIGGIYGDGNIFSIDTDGNNYEDLHDFNNTVGSSPEGSLTISGNVLYGCTYEGGAYNAGIIFAIDTDGSRFRDLFEFNNINGQYPGTSLALSGKLLYGLTWGGGVFNSGIIFVIDSDGSGFRDIHDFNGTQGSNPAGSLLLSGNTLYGTTVYGGSTNQGNIFSIDTNGTNYRDLYDFNGGTYGNYYFSDLAISGNVLYGMTKNGGAIFRGNIYTLHKDGSGFRDLFDFNGINGDGPEYGALIFSGNLMYGMTSNGGGGYGNIFSIDTNGNGIRDLFDFDETDGLVPVAALTLAGKMLYGMTASGGIYNDGVVFQLDTLPIYFIKDSIVSLNIACYDSSTGSATVFPSGGTLTYYYNWEPGGGTTATINSLSAGIYTITVTDFTGHKGIDSVTITQPSSALLINTSSLSSNCKISNGYASVNVTGGVPPYSYYWSPFGGTNSIATGLSFGTYSCVTTDSLGCTNTKLFNIKDSGVLKVIVSGINLRCHGDSSGSAKTNVTGGAKPYTYLWSPYGGSDSIAQNLVSGEYLITVTDTNGCKTDTSIVITQPVQITMNMFLYPDTGNCNGSAWVSVIGGTSPFTYLWSNLTMMDSISRLCSGIYCCTITDENGCLDSNCINVYNDSNVSTGIKPMVKSETKIHVFPNPSNGIFIIQSQGGIRESSIEIYNVLGEKVFTDFLHPVLRDNIIDLGAQPNGVYFYRVLSENGVLIGEGKMIVEK